MSETLEWVTPDGAVFDLTDGSDGLVWRWQTIGRFAPPIAIIEDPAPGQAGARWRSVRHAPRDVTIPVYVEANSEVNLRAALRSWVRRFDPVVGEGKLRCTGPDAAVRELVCRYAAGLELLESQAAVGWWESAAVVLRAVDPYWYDQTDTTEDWAYTAGAGAFFPLSFPFTLASSEVGGDVTIDNTGDVEAWPVWTIEGPASDVELTNTTTGARLLVAGTVGTGATLVIDTRPGEKSVLVDGSVSLFSSLTGSLWALAPGENELTVAVGNAGPATTVELAYKRRWLCA